MIYFEDVQIPCDRCGKQIEGREIPGHSTCGFYRTGPGSLWSKYADEGETVICDACMWADPRYQADYPPLEDGD